MRIDDGSDPGENRAVDETGLILAAKQGDRDAFEEIVKRHKSIVARTVLAMLGNCPEAEDVGQETFLRFYKALSDFRGESSIGTYLTRIAVNLSMNELKRRKRKSMIFSRKPLENFTTIAQRDGNPSTDTELIQMALARLDIKSRSVVVLRLIDGYSVKETAKILNIPVGTVLSRLSRAQQKLKQLLEPYLGD